MEKFQLGQFPRGLSLRKKGQNRGLNKGQNIPSNLSFHRLTVEGDNGGDDMKTSCDKIAAALVARHKYKARDRGQAECTDPLLVRTELYAQDGIIRFTGQSTPVVPYQQYAEDLNLLHTMCQSSTCQNACKHRLNILEEKYEMYVLLNTEIEETTCKLRHGGGVCGPAMKVDTTVRASTAFNAQRLVDFIVKTYETKGSDIVMKNPLPLTLRQLFEKLGVRDPYTLTVEGLGLHPSNQTRFHRFDIFDPDLNRGGLVGAEICQTFLKFNNYNNGEYYSTLLKSLLEANEKSKGFATEYSVPLYGCNREEWPQLAKFIKTLQPANVETQESSRVLKKNMFTIQITRLAELRMSGFYNCSNVMEQLEHIFHPMFEATLKPHEARYKDIDLVLSQVGAFSIFSDNEGTNVVPPHRPPYDWQWSEPVPDTYFAYYIWANLASLNQLRRRKNLNTFQFVPTSNDFAHHSTAMMYLSFLTADRLNNGATIADNPALQYLYFLGKIGLSISPLYNNGLYHSYFKNPMLCLFKRGLNISLATYSPLHYHHSDEPLIEEYSTVHRLYKMTSTDVAEIALNSVLMSSFSNAFKKEHLGDDYDKNILGHDFQKTCVPHIRLCFREDTLRAEFDILRTSLESSNGSSKHFVVWQELESYIKCTYKWSYTPVQTREGHNFNIDRCKYLRMDIQGPQEHNTTLSAAAESIHQALLMRAKYIRHVQPWKRPNTKTIEDEFQQQEQDLWFCDVLGVWIMKEPHKSAQWPRTIPTLEQYIQDFNEIRRIVSDPMVKVISQRRLMVLLHKFNLHIGLNGVLEAGSVADKGSQNRDFYQAHKVDTHVHMAAGMTARQLLNFIVMKARNHSDEFVIKTKTGVKTLRQVLRDINVDEDHISVDMLQVQADATLFERFDNFNEKYNPLGSGDMRAILLKTNNYMGGRYFAEMTKMTFEQFSRDKYTFAENRLSVYGMEYEEWNKLALWFDTNGVASPHNKWMIQVPRIYSIMKRNGSITSFGQLLQNVFEPLWEVSIYPARNPKLHYFLRHVSGFDSVDNEGLIDPQCPTTPPHEYMEPTNPPYIYWMYFMWANIRTLNEFRSSKGLSTFAFRPHCGESGSTEHLMGNFLVADAINHGINLRQDSSLQYLYYLAQVGLAVSPLSNNSLFLDYLQNPFPFFFKRGLNVSLSTDDPLQFHHTQEPLLEEYSIASKVWKLSPNDLCEIARNSVVQSGFDHKWKCHAIGDKYFLSSTAANSHATHLSDIRLAFRFEVYHTEVNYLEKLCPGDLHFNRAMYTQDEELKILRELREKDSDDTQENAVNRSCKDDDDSTMNGHLAFVHRLQDENDELHEKVARLTEQLQLSSTTSQQNGDKSWQLASSSPRNRNGSRFVQEGSNDLVEPSSKRSPRTSARWVQEETVDPQSSVPHPPPPALTAKMTRQGIIDGIQKIIESSETLWPTTIGKGDSFNDTDNFSTTNSSSLIRSPNGILAPRIVSAKAPGSPLFVMHPAPFSAHISRPAVPESSPASPPVNPKPIGALAPPPRKRRQGR